MMEPKELIESRMTGSHTDCVLKSKKLKVISRYTTWSQNHLDSSLDEQLESVEDEDAVE